MTQGFSWDKAKEKALEVLKEKLCNTPLLELPNFDKIFEIVFDASGVGIGGVLKQTRSCWHTLVRTCYGRPCITPYMLRSCMPW